MSSTKGDNFTTSMIFRVGKMGIQTILLYGQTLLHCGLSDFPSAVKNELDCGILNLRGIIVVYMNIR